MYGKAEATFILRVGRKRLIDQYWSASNATGTVYNWFSPTNIALNINRRTSKMDLVYSFSSGVYAAQKITQKVSSSIKTALQGRSLCERAHNIKASVHQSRSNFLPPISHTTTNLTPPISLLNYIVIPNLFIFKTLSLCFKPNPYDLANTNTT